MKSHTPPPKPKGKEANTFINVHERHAQLTERRALSQKGGHSATLTENSKYIFHLPQSLIDSSLNLGINHCTNCPILWNLEWINYYHSIALAMRLVSITNYLIIDNIKVRKWDNC